MEEYCWSVPLLGRPRLQTSRAGSIDVIAVATNPEHAAGHLGDAIAGPQPVSAV
jgi:hypothetical protein